MSFEVRTTLETVAPLAQQHSCLRIGDVSIRLDEQYDGAISLGPELKPFLVDVVHPDVNVRIDWQRELKPWHGDPVFNSGAVWTLFRDADRLVFDFTTPFLGEDPYKRMRVDRNFTYAQVTLNRTLLSEDVCPLEYPTDELLITNYLASHTLGVEVHGCGLIDSAAGGQLFLGHSGAGKSTTTRIWHALRNPFILSDDRIILRVDGGKLRMYGTPWHGEAAFAEQGNATLKRIFILQHGAENHIRLLPKAQAVGEVFARSFPPFHSAEGLDCALAFISRALDLVPCYEFQFVPDHSAVHAVLEFHD